jgi:hypothetical protein
MVEAALVVAAVDIDVTTITTRAIAATGSLATKKMIKTQIPEFPQLSSIYFDDYEFLSVTSPVVKN